MLDLKPLLETEGAKGKGNNWGIPNVSDSKKMLLQSTMAACLVV